MRHLNGVYTQAFNRRHVKSGHVLQGRWPLQTENRAARAIVVEKKTHLLELARYVVLNPVRARAVRSARDWRWSSYRATAGMAEAPEFLTTDWVLAQFHRMLKEVPRRERLATRPSLDELFSDVHDKAERDHRIHTAVRAHEYTLQAVANVLGFHYSTISMIAKRVAACLETPRVKI
jgi:putative transposase